MGQVYDIPYSALIATLLLKNRVVKFEEIGRFEKMISSLGYNYYVIDDVYFTDMPLCYCIDSFLSKFLVSYNNSFFIRNDLDYDSIVGDKTIREILEETARYPGDILINYIGYQVIQKDKIEDKVKGLSKIRKLLSNYNKPISRLKMGV